VALLAMPVSTIIKALVRAKPVHRRCKLICRSAIPPRWSWIAWICHDRILSQLPPLARPKGFNRRREKRTYQREEDEYLNRGSLWWPPWCIRDLSQLCSDSGICWPAWLLLPSQNLPRSICARKVWIWPRVWLDRQEVQYDPWQYRPTKAKSKLDENQQSST